MSLLVRSAMIQARVTPWVKEQSTLILRELGVTMSQAMELFLRRLIEDRRIPFDIVALSEVHQPHDLQGRGTAASMSQRKVRRSSRKNNSKDF